MRWARPYEKGLFDIAIYWCDEATFNAKYDQKSKAERERIKREWEARGFQLKPEDIDRHERLLWQQLMMPWKYNQIVGWVRIYIFGNQLRGDYWLIEAKRFGPTLKKKRFIHRGKAFELWLHAKETNKQLFGRMLNRLRKLEEVDLKYNPRTRRCVLDLECFESLGRFVNWRRMMKGKS